MKVKITIIAVLIAIMLVPVFTACRSSGQEVLAFDEEVMIMEHVEDITPIIPTGPVHLTVFVYDSCGGCGVGMLGCGACDIQDRLHLQIRAQLGDRLHDGSIRYRLHNTRLDTHRDMHVDMIEHFNVTENLHSILPIAFIGSEYEAFYLAGDDMVPFIQEKLDRYLAGECMDVIRKDIIDLME